MSSRKAPKPDNDDSVKVGKKEFPNPSAETVKFDPKESTPLRNKKLQT